MWIRIRYCNLIWWQCGSGRYFFIFITERYGKKWPVPYRVPVPVPLPVLINFFLPNCIDIYEFYFLFEEKKLSSSSVLAWIRIRMLNPDWAKMLDPYPNWSQSGFTTLDFWVNPVLYFVYFAQLFRIIRHRTSPSPTPATMGSSYSGALHSLAAKSRTSLVRMASNASSFAGRRYASFHLPHANARHRHQGPVFGFQPNQCFFLQ
jgi:hypothetical protein